MPLLRALAKLAVGAQPEAGAAVVARRLKSIGLVDFPWALVAAAVSKRMV